MKKEGLLLILVILNSCAILLIGFAAFVYALETGPGSSAEKTQKYIQAEYENLKKWVNDENGNMRSWVFEANKETIRQVREVVGK